MSSAGLSNTDLLSLLNLCDPAELAALLASQQQPVQPLVSEPLTGLDGLTDGLGASLLNSLGGATAPTAWQLQDAATKDYLLQEMAQSLAVTMEQQRKQQQIATALQLRALQQQQELAALQQLNAAVPPLNAATSNPAQRHLAAFSRAISSDLEYRSTQSLHSQHAAHAAAAGAYQRASSVDLEGLTSPLVPPAHMGGVSPLSHHSSHLAPGRSYSSENLEPRRHPLQRGTPLHLGNPPSGRAPPQSRPSFPSSRNPGPRGHRGHGGQRHGATAKAPCWAGSDWHPLKAVLSSASHAAAPSGTGVFLPHLAAENTKAPPERTSSDRLSSHAASSSEGKQASAGTTGSGSDEQRTSISSDAASGPAGHVHHADTSPACSLDGVSTCSDPWSRSSTMDMDANAVNTHGVPGATGGAGPGPSPLSVDPLKRNPPALREGFDEADEFGPLAKELADLMSRQVMLEN